MSLPAEGYDENAEKSIDIKEFLSKHKLLNILEILKSRDVTIEELMEFDDNDLASFSKEDLKLDTLQKTRFIKAVKSLNKSHIPNKLNITNKPKQLTISHDEEKALVKLNNTFDVVNKLLNDLNGSSFKHLELTSNKTNNEIENAINNVIKNILLKKNEILNEIDEMT
eukprot:428026_1